MKPYIKISTMLVVALAGMWMAAAASFAHYLWVEETNGKYAVCRGTIGERIDPYDPVCVTEISVFSGDSTELAITRTDEKTRAVFTAAQKPALAAVVARWGDRVNTTRGKKLMSRKQAESEGLTVISAFTSTQYAKTLLAPAGINTRPLGMKLELVPGADPAMLSAGTPINFKLLFDGRPLAGVSILTNHHQDVVTDENGVASLVFDKSGTHLLYATHQTPAEKDSGLDFLKFMTFLTFEVKE
jgi:nickel transport protein